MAKLRGTVRRSDLEGGHWQLVGDDGTTYQLADGGGVAELRRDGARVEVEASVDRQAVSIGMTGPILRVKSAKPI